MIPMAEVLRCEACQRHFAMFPRKKYVRFAWFKETGALTGLRIKGPPGPVCDSCAYIPRCFLNKGGKENISRPSIHPFRIRNRFETSGSAAKLA